MEVHFKEQWGAFFAGYGFTGFEDFFDLSEGQVINKNEKRDVVVFSLGEGDERKEFFMKRFYCPHYKDILFTLFNFGHFCSQAGCEWKNANFLLDNGVGAYRPVCYGEDNVFGLERRSFFITEKLAGECLADYVSREWDRMEQEQREGLMVTLAELVRRVHEAGVSLPDLYLWHIFIDEGDGERRFAVIDLHRMKIKVKGDGERVRNLGAFVFSLSPDYFDDSLRDIFLDSYVQGYGCDKGAFKKRVLKRAEVLLNRRRRQEY